MFQIHPATLQRVQLARLTPARMTEILRALEAAINKHGTEDASVTLEYTLPGEVFSGTDLLPVLILGLRKAIPNAVDVPAPSGLVLPDRP